MAYGVYSLDQTYEEDGEPGEGSRFEKYTSFNEDGYKKLEDIEIINTVNELESSDTSSSDRKTYEISKKAHMPF